MDTTNDTSSDVKHSAVAWLLRELIHADLNMVQQLRMRLAQIDDPALRGELRKMLGPDNLIVAYDVNEGPAKSEVQEADLRV